MSILPRRGIGALDDGSVYIKQKRNDVEGDDIVFIH
jgi:hypothetical protein